MIRLRSISAVAIAALVAVGQGPTAQARAPRGIGHYFRLQEKVNRWRVANAEMFRKIVGGDYRNQVVLYRDREMTAFVDWTDPDHPQWNRKAPLDSSLALRPRAAHVLFVPNERFEHISATLHEKIVLSDVMRTQRLMTKAAELGAKLGLRNVDVFENSAQGVSVGWQHIHLVGDKPVDFRYPASLKPPR